MIVQIFPVVAFSSYSWALFVPLVKFLLLIYVCTNFMPCKPNICTVYCCGSHDVSRGPSLFLDIKKRGQIRYFSYIKKRICSPGFGSRRQIECWSENLGTVKFVKEFSLSWCLLCYNSDPIIQSVGVLLPRTDRAASQLSHCHPEGNCSKHILNLDGLKCLVRLLITRIILLAVSLVESRCFSSYRLMFSSLEINVFKLF